MTEAIATPVRTSAHGNGARVSLPLLTSSSLSVARACLRLYRNRHALGLHGLQREEAPELGDLVHVGLAAWWIGLGDQRVVLAVSAMRAHAQAKQIDRFQSARAEAMLVGYHARWADEADNYEVLAVEREFRAPLVNPATAAESKSFRLGGKIDAIVRDRRDGRTLIVEHKTSSEDIGPGGFYWMRRHMDGQVSTYFDGARALGFDPAGCLYDVLAKPDLRPLKATPEESRKYTREGRLYANQRERDETPEEYGARIVEKIAEDVERYYARAEIARDSEDLREAARDRWQLAVILRDAHRTGTWPRNPDACLRFGRPCEFLEACAGRADLADPFLFRKGSPQPELSAEETAQSEST
jgi:hypothetical protein